MPKLQSQLQAIRRELENTVSLPLAAELRRILPSRDEAPSAGALRIECAALLNWANSLAIQMLSELQAARACLSRASGGLIATAPAHPGPGRPDRLPSGAPVAPAGSSSNWIVTASLPGGLRCM